MTHHAHNKTIMTLPRANALGRRQITYSNLVVVARRKREMVVGDGCLSVGQT